MPLTCRTWNGALAGVRPREGLGRSLVDRSRAKAAAEDQQAGDLGLDHEAAAGRGPVRLEDRPRHRPAGVQVEGTVAAGDPKGEADALCAPRQQPVCDPEVAVSLGQDQGKPHSGCRHARRPGDVAAAAHDGIGVALTQQAPRRAYGDPRPARGGGGLERVAAVEPAHRKEVDLIARLRDQLGLGPLARADEADRSAALSERVGDG